MRLDCLASTLRFEAREHEVQPAMFGGLTGSERNALLHRAGPHRASA